MKELRPYQHKAINECWEALKENNDPVLLMASVGSGKSLMIAHILLKMQKANKKVLCLVSNAELVRNNFATFINEGGKACIYSAALNQKDYHESIIFGTPATVANGIKNEEPISKIKFNLIVVDEAHNINFHHDNSCFMRIFRNYSGNYEPLRILGATGTNYRFKGNPIVGDKCFFKNQVGNITLEQLIQDNYLIEPQFEVDKNLLIDFSKVKVKRNGLFDQKELSNVVEENKNKTKLICEQIIKIIEEQNRFGIVIFATNKKHAEEILSYLPVHESALILGETANNERTTLFDKARQGEIRYLVNISIISVGVDIPAYDTLAYLRPTESLVLLVQTLGRILRLSPSTGKHSALVLDFAGNIDRHRDWDNPIIKKAVVQTLDKDKPLVISCPQCLTMNTEYSRRCIGQKESSRCDYYFEFKCCSKCNVKNDIAARQCWNCKIALIDPNDKLSLLHSVSYEVKVIKAKYAISGTQKGFRINCLYQCIDDKGNVGFVFENYSPINDKSVRVFYGQFVKKHIEDASRWYPHLYNRAKVELMLKFVRTPKRLLITETKNGHKIKQKYFTNIERKKYA